MEAYYLWHHKGCGEVKVVFVCVCVCVLVCVHVLHLYGSIAEEAQKEAESGENSFHSTMPIRRHTPPSMAKDCPGTVPGGNLDMCVYRKQKKTYRLRKYTNKYTVVILN